MSSALGDEVIDNGLGTTINTEHSPKSIRELSHTVKNHLGEQKLIIKSEKDAGLHNKEVSFDNDDSHPQVTKEAALGHTSYSEEKDSSKISAYARLDFDNYTFFVQTLQVILGRKSNDELINGSQHSVDVHLSSKRPFQDGMQRSFIILEPKDLNYRFWVEMVLLLMICS